MSRISGRLSHFTAAFTAIAICATSWHATVRADCTPQWVSGFDNPAGPLSGPVMATAVFDDGNGPALYAAGNFVSNSGTTVYSVTKWNGSSWSPLGTGPEGIVRALAVFDDGSGPALYAGGDFTQEGGAPANHISKWDGGDWSPVGAGVSGTIWAFTVFNDGSGPALYAGGAFTSAGGVAANRVAKWNGATWSALGAGMSGIVRSLEVFNDGSGAAIYAGGDFLSAGGLAVDRMARWNGAAWSAMPGMNDTVWALHASGGSLYAGGSFMIAGGGAVNRIARWDGTTWSAVGAGLNESVYALTDFNDGGGAALYAAGAFNQLGGGAGANRIAKWNGSVWSSVAGGADSEVRTLTAFDDGNGSRLFAGGFFQKLDSHAVKSVGAWNGTIWSALGGEGGTDGSIGRLISFDDGSGPALFASGGFGTAGGVRADGLAKWNGSNWSPVNVNASSSGALEVVDDGSGPHLFAGINQPQPSYKYGVAKWDGNAFVTIATGLDSPVQDMVGFDDGTGSALYAGGSFRQAGGVYLNGIARLDGGSWSNLGTGLSVTNHPSDGVRAMIVFDDGNGPALYVGGQFNSAGGLAVQNIAKWDGAAWSRLGTGLIAAINSLATFDDGTGPALYAGGQFWQTGSGVPANGIARWNGAEWLPVGDGFRSGPVTSMVVFDDGSGPALFIAGYTIGSGQSGSPPRLGKWDGHTWHLIELQSNADAIALSLFDNGSLPLLFVGGNFTTAGNSPAYHIAAMSGCSFVVEPPPPAPIPEPTDPVAVPGDDVIDIPVVAAPVDSVGILPDTEAPQAAGELQAPVATGAGFCGMGMWMATLGLLTGIWMMRRTDSRQRR